MRNNATGDAGPLTICAIGDGVSTHVATRARWFAERGHRVFLLTVLPSPSGIPGVREVDLNAAPVVVGAARLVGRFRSLFREVRQASRRGATGTRIPLRRAGEVGSPSGSCSRSLVRLVGHRALTGLALLHALRRYKPDVVHVHYADSYYGWIPGLLGARPLVVTVMGSDVASFEERDHPETAREWLTLRLLREADYITPPSDFLVDVVNRLGDFRDKTERIIWGISLDRFGPRDESDLRRRLGLTSAARVIVSPKILRPFYRIHVLVEAMAIVRRSCPDAVLVMSEYAADPEYRDQIARRIDELDLGKHAVFSGVLADADMPAFYNLADMSIAIPPRDGMPVALFESLACGTPQILSRLPRYEEIVQHEESAYFVDPDPEAIAAGIIRLLDDAALRARIAERGRSIVEQQANIDEQAARVERRFRELAAANRPRTVSLTALCSAATDAMRAYLNSRRSG